MDSLEKSLVELKNAMDRHESKESWAQGLSRWKDKEGVIKKNGIDLDTQEDDLEAFFKGFGAEIHPLVMLQKAFQNGLIHSYKSQSVPEIYGKWRRNVCEWCEECFGENGYSGHECKKMGYGNFIFIFNEGREDELLALIKPMYKLPLDRHNSAHTSTPITKEPPIQQLSENRSNHFNNSGVNEKIEDNNCADSRVNEKIEDNICEDSGMMKEIEDKTTLKCKEGVRELCEEDLTVNEGKLQEEDLNVRNKKKDLGENQIKKKIKITGNHTKKGRVNRKKVQEREKQHVEGGTWRGVGECQERMRREAVGKMWKYTLRKIPKKKKKTFNVHEEGKLGLVASGSGGGSGRRTAPIVAVEGHEKSKSKSKKRMNVGGVEALLKVAGKCGLIGNQWRQPGGAWKEEKGGKVGKSCWLSGDWWWLAGVGVSCCEGAVIFLGLGVEERERKIIEKLQNTNGKRSSRFGKKKRSSKFGFQQDDVIRDVISNSNAVLKCLKVDQVILSPRKLKTFSPFLNIFTPISFSSFTLIHLYKILKPKC